MNKLAIFCVWACSFTLLQAEESGKVPDLQVPPGFTVELVAGPPLVEHPMMAGFDEQGRLFVAESAGQNLRADDLLKNPPNSIRMLEDTDGDGRFDKSTVFADKMTLPMGALWYRGGLYVASPPNIWRLEDTDGDGKADKRQELVSKFGFTGNAADIHGCFLGPNGRIYWTDGRHGHEFTDAQGRVVSKGLAARVFSCRPDGSQVEVFCGGGMDNPVEVAFFDNGDMLGTMTFYNPDRDRHDALVHFVYGGVYPKHHPCLAEFQRTGDLMPALSLFGVTAPSGCTIYRGSHFGPEFRNHAFSAQFNTHKITRHKITQHGATYQAVDEDFLVSSNADFHPTDVLEDADGSLLVIDTGGWFRIGCPTSQIAKPDILGGIYRIRRTAAPRVEDPRGLRLDWAQAPVFQLLDLLADARPAVRDRAIDTLALRFETAEPAVLSNALADARPVVRQGVVWALCRVDTPEARRAIRKVLGDGDAGVRKAAAQSAGVWKDGAALAKLAVCLNAEEPQVRREAGMAVGRLGKAEAIPALLAALRSGGDRFVEHALIYALIELNQPQATLAGLQDSSPQVRRAALIALDQMRNSTLTREQVAPLLDTADLPLQQAALDVITRHEGWSQEIVGLLGQWLAAKELPEARREMMRGALLAFQKEEQVQALVANNLARADTSPDAQLLLLEVISGSELPMLPDRWRDQLGTALQAKDERLVRQAMAAIRATGVNEFNERLLQMGGREEWSADLRLWALHVAASHGAKLEGPLFVWLAARFDADIPVLERLMVAETLGRASLAADQLPVVAGLVARAGPLELLPLLATFEKSKDAALGGQLLAALAKSPGLDSMMPNQLQKLVTQFPGLEEAAKPLLARLAQDAAAQQTRLAELLQQLTPGDVERGKAVFLGRQAACFACHRVRGEGGAIGPDLSKIGEVRTPRDLLEAIVFPSASFARGFETITVQTEDGLAHSGVIGRETADAIYLRTTTREEIRVLRNHIETILPSKVSVMPQGLDKALTPEQISDVIAYLRTLK